MRNHAFYCGLVLLSLVATPAPGQDSSIRLTGKPYIDMDYGAFLTASIEVRPGNIAQKGIAIRLDDGPGGVSQGNAFAVFETDTLRFAGVWTGRGLIDWRGIALDGKHAIHPRIVGTLVLSNGNGPGWQGPGKETWEDTRLRGVDKIAYGPLPRGWAHWKGLHRQGDRVVLEYTVGSTRVREQPRLVRIGQQQIFCRMIEVGPSATSLVLQVASESAGAVQVLDRSAKAAVADKINARDSLAMLASSTTAPTDQISLARDFTVSAWIRTRAPTGTIFSRAAIRGQWVPKGKTFFVRGGRLGFDVGWLGVVTGTRPVNDGRWHHVALTYTHNSGQTRLYLDGTPDGARPLRSPDDPGHVIRLGYTATNFMPGLRGALDEVQVYHRALPADQIRKLAADGDVVEGRIARWSFEKLTGQRVANLQQGGYDGQVRGARSTAGHRGQALQFNGGTSQVRIASRAKAKPRAVDWSKQTVVAAIVQGPAKTAWVQDSRGALRLSIAASKTSRRFRILSWKGPGGAAARIAKKLDSQPETTGWSNPDKGGPSQWKQVVETTIARGTSKGPLAIDTLTTPEKNPWRSWMRLGGFDFFKNPSRAAICTWQGDVWLVEGLGKSLDATDKATLKWRRIAAGLFQPLGLKIVNEQIFVLGRDQITRLVDRNGDGETDFYENFNNDAQVTEHFHEFAMDLQADRHGNFYYAKGARHALSAIVPQHGSIIKVSADGSSSEILANGFRAPNGLALNPDGSFLSSDQEGHWTPMNRINWIRKGGFYGNMMSYVPDRKDTSYEPPLCWIHKQTDRSPSSQVWVNSDNWALPRGSLLSLSYGTGRIWRVIYEHVGTVPQGGIIRLPIPELPTGIHRGRFHPADGQLYICGLFGWSSNKTRPGGLFRIRATGQPANLPENLSAVPQGIVLRFPRALEKKTALEAGRYNIERWNYRRAASYGSRDYRVSDGKEGRDRVEVTGVQLSKDGRSVLLAFADMRPCMQMRVRYNLATAKGQSLAGQVEHTINVVNGPTHLATLGFDPAGAPVPRIRTGPPRKGLANGLVLSMKSRTGRNPQSLDARVSRLAALSVAPGQTLSPRIKPGPFVAGFHGLLDVELTDRYTFTAELSGTVSVRINGTTVLESSGSDRQAATPVDLKSGLNTLEISYSAPAKGSSRLRLAWESPRFDRELIPSRSLWHDPRHPALVRWSPVRRGRELFTAHRCAGCHSEVAKPREGITLDQAAIDFNPTWLAHWLGDPTAVRNHTRMPGLFGDTPAEKQALHDVVAFLTRRPAPAAISTAGMIQRGEVLWEELGCISCHRFSPAKQPDEWNRTSLHYVSTKFLPPALDRFLRQPQRHNRWSRMPDFRLSESQARNLRDWIRSRSTGRLKPPIGTLPGDPERGKQQFLSRGCLACHQVSGMKSPAHRPVGLAFGRKQPGGCLAVVVGSRRDSTRVPDYRFSPDQRSDLAAYLALTRDAAPDRSPLELVQSTMRELRCVACHDRDSHSSPRRLIIADESDRGVLPEVLPDLTWAGEKLHSDWTRQLLTGRLKHPSRPWLKGRMPAFGAWANRLVSGLAAEHGVSETSRPGPDPDGALATLGGKLALKQNGFNCLQCHGVGKTPAIAPFDNRGVNFARVRTRLRYNFYLDWMFDPLRLDPHSKMPRFSPDRKTTVLRDVLDGDARQQFDALWHYLQATRDE